jgi:cytochrome c6
MTRRVGASVAAALVLAAATLHCSAQSGPSAVNQTASFSADDIAAGSAQYNRTCAQCHGRNMVNSGTTSYDLRRFPVDQMDRFLLSVNKGKGNMPSFEAALTPEQIKVLWAYVGTRGGKEP